jgi:predicted lipoprotein with Yx(FWY)xxD motif
MKTFIAVVVVLILVAGGWWWMQHPDLASSLDLPLPNSHTAPSKYAYVDGNLLLGTDASENDGKYLIGYNGMTLYTFARDAGNVSSCTGLCAATWPPYTISSRDALANVQAGIGGKVDAFTRGDGSTQVTYDGQPLYFYANDKTSGDMFGNGIGGVWYIAKP